LQGFDLIFSPVVSIAAEIIKDIKMLAINYRKPILMIQRFVRKQSITDSKEQ
jgi:hypothetical protein